MTKKRKRTARAAATQTTTPAPRNIRRRFPHVKTVVDADGPITAHVTPVDCENAVPLDASDCALARAVCRVYHADHAVIGLNSSYVIKGTQAIRYATSQRIAREITCFDRHHDFELGPYTLTPKRPSDRLVARSERERSRRATRPDPRPRHDTNPPRVIGTARVRLLTSREGVR